MEHTEETTAVLTGNEPPNGTKLIVDVGMDGWKVIERDDAEAKLWGNDWDDDQHWFASGDFTSDPMSLHQHIKYADAVYALGEPLAVFNQ